ncbi:hypothetical protein HW41_00915 [Apilactobacillus kunkeei]|nr:hypothetical protein HW41_00915 [Apilactobacillus kunkeei]
MDLNEEKNSNDFEKKHTNLGKKISLSIIAILIVLGIFIFILGHQYVKESLKPLNPKDKELIQVQIPMGASDKKIGSILQESKIVKSGLVFDYFVNSHNYSGLKAGYYELSPSMSLQKIADKLKKGGTAQPLQGKYGRLLVREGDNIDEIAQSVEQSSQYSSADFKKLMKDTDFLNQLKKKYPKLLDSAFKAKNRKYVLEGYIYPATYNSQKNVTLKQIVNQMVAKTNYEFSPYFKEIKKQNLTVDEAITLASFIEHNHVDKKDQEKIAGILYNRLNSNLPLEVQSSIRYANGKVSGQKLSKKDYDANTPYNLYKNTGFPPSAINNPTVKSLDSILNPKDMTTFYLAYSVNMNNKKVKYYNSDKDVDDLIGNDSVMR